VWNAKTGQTQLTWSDVGAGHAIAFSPDGKRIASGAGSEAKRFSGGVSKTNFQAQGRLLTQILFFCKGQIFRRFWATDNF